MKHRLRYSKHLWVPILIIVLLAQTLTIIILVNRVRILWFENNQPDTQINLVTKYYIHEAMTSLYSINPVSIDAPAGRIYFPDLRVYLPYNDKSKQIDYVYSPANAGMPAQGSFNTRTAINFLPNNFDQVPCLQRMFDYSVDKQISGEKLSDKIKLADGRTIYLYLNQTAANSETCHQIWNEFSLSPAAVLAELKQLQSY